MTHFPAPRRQFAGNDVTKQNMETLEMIMLQHLYIAFILFISIFAPMAFVAPLLVAGPAGSHFVITAELYLLDGVKVAACSVAVPLKLAGHEARFIMLRK